MAKRFAGLGVDKQICGRISWPVSHDAQVPLHSISRCNENPKTPCCPQYSPQVFRFSRGPGETAVLEDSQGDLFPVTVVRILDNTMIVKVQRLVVSIAVRMTGRAGMCLRRGFPRKWFGRREVHASMMRRISD